MSDRIFIFSPFWLHVGSILGADFGDFSCYFLASFFDRLLKASGGILGVILADFGGSFWSNLKKVAHMLVANFGSSVGVHSTRSCIIPSPCGQLEKSCVHRDKLIVR